MSVTHFLTSGASGVSPMRPLLQTPRIHFDFGRSPFLPAELAWLGIQRPLIVTDARLATLDVFRSVEAALPANLSYEVFNRVPENPTVQAVHDCATAWRESESDSFVAVGGGSVIDCAKAAALLARHSGDLTYYLSHPEHIISAPAPLIAVPTTAGSGSEVSRGCGIHPDETSRTLGINHPLMVPRVAICDPELTLSLPPHLIAGTGLDALSHCIEGFLATTHNPIIDAIALDGISRLVGHIENAVFDGRDRGARWNVMMAAVQGGLSIYKGLGPVHAIATTCGDRGLHHGTLCALAMPHVLRLWEEKGLNKLGAIATALSCVADQSPADAVDGLIVRLGLPTTFSKLDYGECDLDEMANDCAKSFFNVPSPYRPSVGEYRTILQALCA